MNEWYYLCPACNGTVDDMEAAHQCNWPFNVTDPCPRCGRRGTLHESEMTEAEIVGARRRTEEDDEARNRVD